MGGEITVWWGPDDMVSALGFGTEENMAAVRAMKSSLASWHDATPVCLIDRKRLGALAAEQGLAGYTPLERLVLATLGGVVARSGVTPADKRALIVLATTKGEIGSLGSAPERCDLNRTAEVVGRYFGTAHRPLLISNACISGVSAIVIAARLIRSGRYDHVFVAGFDLLSDFIVSGFNAFKSVSPTLCRPYDAARDGLTLGEACGAVLLTRDRRLSGTGVSVAGGGISNDANHISAPSRTGDGLWYAIRAALAEAGTGAGEVGLVNTHGTATAYNDEMESKALHLAGLCGVPCNSLKPYFGHTLGASGVIESIVTVRELCEGTCFGVKGYAECGVPYPPDVSAAHREIRTDTALKTASGFGGCNAAVVFRRAAGPNAAPGNETAEGQGCGPNTGVQGGNDCLEAACTRSGTAMSANDRGHGKNAVGHGNPDTGEKASGHAETGTGRHGSGIRCHDTAHVVIAQHPSLPFDAFIRERYRALADPNMKFSKMDDLCKLAYVASCELLSGHRPDCPAERIGVVMANRSASLDSDRRHQAIIDAGDGCGASPAVFVYTLPNIMLGQVAIKHGLKGESTFFAFPDKSSNFIREYAASLIAEGRMDRPVGLVRIRRRQLRLRTDINRKNGTRYDGRSGTATQTTNYRSAEPRGDHRRRDSDRRAAVRRRAGTRLDRRTGNHPPARKTLRHTAGEPGRSQTDILFGSHAGRLYPQEPPAMSIAVCGIGIVSAIGIGAGETLGNLRTGRSGIGKPTLLGSAVDVPVGEVKRDNAALGELLGIPEREHPSRTALLGMAAAAQAVADAAIPAGARVALVSGTSVGGMDLTENFYRDFRTDKAKGRLRDVAGHDCADSTQRIARYCGIGGYTATVSTACSSAANAIVTGALLLGSGMADYVVAGGTDALCRFTLNGFNSLSVLDREPCRPFDATRAGLNLGEGAGYLVLTHERPGMRTYCRLAGYANANDAYHQTASSQTGEGAYRAMAGALAQSGLRCVDYINVHGTATPNNDLTEGTALRRLFGGQVPPFSSTKGYTGHALAAAGGIEAVLAVLAITHGLRYGNPGFAEPIPELGLHPVARTQEADVRSVLSNSFGFGGNCCSLIFAK